MTLDAAAVERLADLAKTTSMAMDEALADVPVSAIAKYGQNYAKWCVALGVPLSPEIVIVLLGRVLDKVGDPEQAQVDVVGEAFKAMLAARAECAQILRS